MNLTQAALKRTRFTIVAAFGLAFVGLCVLFNFPSTEEPTVPVRTATVVAFWPGASTERQERLVARPLEEHIREIPEVEHIDTVVRTGMTFIYVNLRGDTAPGKLAGIWQRLKNKVSAATGELPDGVSTPTVDDEFGRVAVRSLALTGQGYSAGQLQDWAKKIRERLQSMPGLEQIALYGVREERVYVELSPDRMAAAGTSLGAVAKNLAARNIFSAPGEIDAQGQTLALEPSGDLPTVADLAAVVKPHHVVETADLIFERLKEQSRDVIVGFDGLFAVETALPLSRRVLLDETSTTGIQETQRAPT